MSANDGFDRLTITQGDITKETVDAVVNAANQTLLGGGGVDGAIHRAGGPAILEECRKLGGCETGDAKATTAGNMPSKWVIHTVGPVYRDGTRGEPELLANCYRRSLETAIEIGAKTVAFPAISCGVYGYPIPDAAAIAVRTIADFLADEESITEVRMVLFSEDVRDIFQSACEAAKSE